MGRDAGKTGRRYAIISGKGGVGKTVLTANMAAALSAGGRKTLVIDADLGLANLDVLLGINPVYSLQQVVHGTRTLEEVLVHTPGGFDLLPAGSGWLEGMAFTPSLARSLEQLVDCLSLRYDVMLFDAGAGIGDAVLFFCQRADELVLVVTPEPTSMMDAYAIVKILVRRFHRSEFLLVVNHAEAAFPEQTGIRVREHLQGVASRFLPTSENPSILIRLLGSIPTDPAVPRSVGLRQLLIVSESQSPSALGIQRLADALSPMSLAAYGP